MRTGFVSRLRDLITVVPSLFLPSCSSSKDTVEHGATVAGSTVLFCGRIPASSLDAFTTKLARIEEKRTEKEKKKQHTPAFLHALVLDAIEAAQAQEMGEAKSSTEPRGGFTDVGMHTGSPPRGTTWPLVREVIKVRSQISPAVQGRDQASSARESG